MSLSNQTYDFDVEYVFDGSDRVEVTTPESPLGVILEDGERVFAGITDGEIETVIRSEQAFFIKGNQNQCDGFVNGTVVMQENQVFLEDLVAV